MPISDVKLLDCMEGMAQFPDKFFDLAAIDPPYGIGEDGAKNHSRDKKNNFGLKSRVLAKSTKFTPKNWDRLAPPPEYFLELKRVSKHQIIFGANHFIENIPRANSPSWIVWDKMNGESDFADCELAYTSFKSAVRKFQFKWNGMLQGDMKKKQKRIHPTQKPIQLYEWILRNYAKPGDKILDTHLGSGSSRIAAYKMGFDFWGYELDAEYFEAQEKRFKEAIAMPLFDALNNDEQLKIF